jgi:ribonuclease-3
MRLCSSKKLNSKIDRERLRQKLMATLGFSFRQPELLSQALIHSSYANEHAKPEILHNERLEFLGDAVLDLVVSEWLFRTYPNLAEGPMTRARASVVRERSLAAAARQIKLGEYLLLGAGERISDDGGNASILADAFEAIIGAVFLDGGLIPATTLIEKFLGRTMAQAIAGNAIEDYKTKLQEELQKEGSRHIVYEVLTESGPAHAREFAVTVKVDGQTLGSGTGKTKKRAEQEAAKAALSTGCP